MSKYSSIRRALSHLFEIACYHSCGIHPGSRNLHRDEYSGSHNCSANLVHPCAIGANRQSRTAARFLQPVLVMKKGLTGFNMRTLIRLMVSIFVSMQRCRVFFFCSFRRMRMIVVTAAPGCHACLHFVPLMIFIKHWAWLSSPVVLACWTTLSFRSAVIKIPASPAVDTRRYSVLSRPAEKCRRRRIHLW